MSSILPFSSKFHAIAIPLTYTINIRVGLRFDRIQRRMMTPTNNFIWFVTALLSAATNVSAFVPAIPNTRTIQQHDVGYQCRLRMAIDYNDPVVAAEFANVQPMDFDDVETELRAKGIPVAATMRYAGLSKIISCRTILFTDYT
jgi:hypothetical protein